MLQSLSSASRRGYSGPRVLRAAPREGYRLVMPWAQETPDPVTKLSWSSWVEMSLATAKKLGVTFGDVVRVETPSGSVEASVFPRGGILDDVIAIPIGGGHTQSHYGSQAGEGFPGVARGVNVISILPGGHGEDGARVWLSSRADVKRTGRFQRLALSQWTDNQHERGFAQKVSLAALAKDGHDHHGDESLAHGGEGDEGGHEFALPFDPANDSSPESDYRWGMAIDTDRCTGCSACVIACSVENNVPVVGEEQAIRHREMTWLRIDRFVGDGDRREHSSIHIAWLLPIVVENDCGCTKWFTPFWH